MHPSDAFPTFRYHPDPRRTGVVQESDRTCRVCGLARGWIYAGPAYGEEDLEEELCPWCIASGAAAEQFDATFVDDHELVRAGVSAAVIEEVTRRTPGFISWQGERWLAHCGDACEFHGDLPAERLGHLDEAARRGLLDDFSTDMTWERLVAEYEPGEQPAIYWFRCRQCGAERYYADYT